MKSLNISLHRSEFSLLRQAQKCSTLLAPHHLSEIGTPEPSVCPNKCLFCSLCAYQTRVGHRLGNNLYFKLNV